MPKRARDVEPLRSIARRCVSQYGAIDTLRGLVEMGIVAVRDVINDILNFGGHLFRPRIDWDPISSTSRIQYKYSGGRASRLEYKRRWSRFK